MFKDEPFDKFLWFALFSVCRN